MRYRSARTTSATMTSTWDTDYPAVAALAHFKSKQSWVAHISSQHTKQCRMT